MTTTPQSATEKTERLRSKCCGAEMYFGGVSQTSAGENIVHNNCSRCGTPCDILGNPNITNSPDSSLPEPEKKLDLRDDYYIQKIVGLISESMQFVYLKKSQQESLVATDGMDEIWNRAIEQCEKEIRGIIQRNFVERKRVEEMRKPDTILLDGFMMTGEYRIGELRGYNRALNELLSNSANQK